MTDRRGSQPGPQPAAGADLLQLDRSAAPARGLTSWLAGALRAGIRDGRLRPGTELPATRVLAGDLGGSRGGVVEAYQRLREEGLVSGRSGAGTRILPAATTGAGPATSVLLAADDPLSLPRRWGADAEIDLSPGPPAPPPGRLPPGRPGGGRTEPYWPRPPRPTWATATRGATSRCEPRWRAGWPGTAGLAPGRRRFWGTAGGAQ